MEKFIKMFFLFTIFVLGACSNNMREEKIIAGNYSKFEDTLFSNDVYSVPKIPLGIDRPSKEGLYNLTIGDDTFIIQKIHIIDYKNNYMKKAIKIENYGIIEVVYPIEIITAFDTSNIINSGYIVMLDKNNTIKLIEKIDGSSIKPNTKIQKILIAPKYFVEYRLATGDTIPALK